MIIDIITNDGSPLEVTESSITGEDGRKGVGGAELALLTMCRAWHEAGHDVTLYNNPKNGESIFKQCKIEEFNPYDDREVLIIFRSPNVRALKAKGLKVWWSCDQHTVGNFKDFANSVDRIVCISDFHSKYFKSTYGIENATVIGIPVRDWEYVDKPKKKNSCIFTSVPDRGLSQLLPIWDRISDKVPDASLTITSDWGLWCGENVSSQVSPYRQSWSNRKNVVYEGSVLRSKLIEIQSESEFHLYPCIYDELFCISVAESQVAGAIPITSTMGALETTNRFGHKIDGNPGSPDFVGRFVDAAVNLMRTNLPDIRNSARKEFNIEKALMEWENVFK